MASPVVAWATALLFAGLSTASPVISFPINSQVPAVARLGQPFSFVFSPSTFPSSSPMTYSLSNTSKWLSIDSDARRLFGTPGQDDAAPGRVAGVPLNLVATDDSGSTTLTATLVVSADSSPRVEIPLQNQVPDFGTFSSPSSILSAPGKAFSFKLSPNTFSKPPGAAISYYATMVDNTPLPAWISFDPTSLSLSGQTPPAESLVQPPQHFPFRVIATDVVGFAGAAMDLDIVVGNHQLTADKTTVVLNATRGALLSYTGLKDTIKVDGKPAAPGSVVLASTSHIPSWLSVNNHMWQMTGVPPESAESTNFTVTLRDTFSNTLNLTVLIDITGDKAGLFTTVTPNLAITPGKPFSFDLRPYLSSPRDTEVSFETNSSYPWIKIDSSTSTLFGDAPQELKDSAVNVKIKATSKQSKKSASLSLNIAIRAVSSGKGSTPADSGADPTKSSDGQRSSASDSLRNSRFNPVLLAVLLPLLLLLALGVVALFWYFRRRKDSQKRPALSTRDISGPLPGSFVVGPDVSHSLPDFTKRFGKSFSADDVFGPEKKSYFNSRQFFLTRPELPQPTGSVRLLPPNDSPSSDPGTPQEGTGSKLPAAVSGALSTLRPGTRGKISSSLSSITERSIGELVDSRGLESVGSESRRAFRDKIEINVQRFPQTPGSTHTSSPSPTEAMSTPRPGSSRTALDTESAPLRPDSRVSYYPPASAAVRKLSWPWLKGVKGKRQGTKLVPGMQRLSEQPSVLAVDTFTSEKTDKPSPTIPVTQGSETNEATVVESESLPLPQFPSRASLSRPPTRSGPVVTSGDFGGPDPEPLNTSDTPTTNILPTPATTTSLLNPPETSLPSFQLLSRGETPATDSLDMYDGITAHSPFRPSRTWSTVPTTDEWVDETVESLALSRSASQREQQQNWTVLQESSPVITSRDVTASLGRGLPPDIASSVRLGQRREGGGDSGGKGGVEVSAAGLPPTPSGPPRAAVTVGGERGQKREASGLTRKSQSMGVSLRSEGSRSDYAAFI